MLCEVKRWLKTADGTRACVRRLTAFCVKLVLSLIIHHHTAHKSARKGGEAPLREGAVPRRVKRHILPFPSPAMCQCSPSLCAVSTAAIRGRVTLPERAILGARLYNLYNLINHQTGNMTAWIARGWVRPSACSKQRKVCCTLRRKTAELRHGRAL